MPSSKLDATPGRRSSVSIPRIGSHGRLLRLQADARLAKMLRLDPRSSEAGTLHVPTREQLELGAAVRVEVSFGPMADEVVLRGFVQGSTARGERAPLVAIRIVPEHRTRLAYIQEVLSMGRQASARSSRRVASEIHATWFWGLGSHAARISDISRGGAFIRSGAPPSVGSRVGIELNDSMVPHGHAGSLRLEGTVAWSGRSEGQRGFGVKFRVVDRSIAARIKTLVRWQEQHVGLAD